MNFGKIIIVRCSVVLILSQPKELSSISGIKLLTAIARFQLFHIEN